MALPTPAELYYKAQRQIQGYGNAQQANLMTSYRNALGMGMQQLASSGLAGTSIAPSMRMGYMRQYQQALNSLGGQINQYQLGAEQTFGLGGLQSEQSAQQIANQLELGRGSLAVNRQQAELAKQQLELQKQQQAYSQNFEQQRYWQDRADRGYGRIGYSYAPAMMTFATPNFGISPQFSSLAYARFNSGWEGYRA